MMDATGFVAAKDQGERVEVGVAKGNAGLLALRVGAMFDYGVDVAPHPFPLRT